MTIQVNANKTFLQRSKRKTEESIDHTVKYLWFSVQCYISVSQCVPPIMEKSYILTLKILTLGLLKSEIPSSDFLFSPNSCCIFLIADNDFVPFATSERSLYLSSSVFFSRNVKELAVIIVHLLARSNSPCLYFLTICSTCSKHLWLREATNL